MNRAKLRIECGTEDQASMLHAALQPDDGDGVSSRIDGTAIVIEAVSESVMGVVRGLDDALGCIRATGME